MLVWPTSSCITVVQHDSQAARCPHQARLTSAMHMLHMHAEPAVMCCCVALMACLCARSEQLCNVPSCRHAQLRPVQVQDSHANSWLEDSGITQEARSQFDLQTGLGASSCSSLYSVHLAMLIAAPKAKRKPLATQPFQHQAYHR